MSNDTQNSLFLLRQALFADFPPSILPTEWNGSDTAELYTVLLHLRGVIADLAAGNLSSDLPFPGYTSEALKKLQSALKHLTWQTRMIAAGDFSHRIDFMGEFADAFNSITARLEQSTRIICEKERELHRINQGLLDEIAIRQQAQSALAECEKHYCNLTETMREVVWIFNTTTLRFTDVTPSMMILSGYTPEETIARTLEEVLAANSADQFKALIQQHRNPPVIDVGSPDDRCTFEAEFRRKDGSTIWTEVVARFVIDNSTGNLMVHGATRNITVRKGLLQELRRQAMIDELTGIANRRQFLASAEKEIERSRRHGTAFSLLMLHIDHFKNVNDRFGHAMGDLALKSVASTCAGALRASDLIGRVGGEEFAVLIPETNLQQSLPVAERMRQEVAAIRLSSPGGTPIPLTISIGIAELRHYSEGLGELMARADKALYIAKQTGRNRVCTADED